jgi:hypothetical protein
MEYKALYQGQPPRSLLAGNKALSSDACCEHIDERACGRWRGATPSGCSIGIPQGSFRIIQLTAIDCN